MYLGRMIGFGLTDNEKPAALYAVSGRSDSSKARRAVLYKDEGRVAIEPLGELTPEQEAQRDLIFYNAMRIGSPETYLAVTNGIQTDAIIEYASKCGGNSNIIEKIIEKELNRLGPEPDTLKTPRIAGIINGYSTRACHGIIIKFREARSQVIDHHKHGSCRLLSTYSGKDDKNPTPFNGIGSLFVYPHYEIPTISTLEVSAISDVAEELAESLYEWVDPRYIVCTAAAVWDNNKWNIAVKNLHE